MSESPGRNTRHTGSFYGVFAYACVVLSCYGGFFGFENFYNSAWSVPVVFGLGAIYATLGVLAGGTLSCRSTKASALYYSVQCAVLTAIIFISPVRGFMGVLVLPLVSQGIFDLRARYAAALAIYLFGINVALWAVPYGWSGVRNAIINYTAAFAFTIVFSIITRRAVFSRRTEEALRQQVEAANQQLRAQAAQMEELATTRERNRLAREIHDGVGHYLTVVKTQLDAAAALLPSQPDRAREAVTKAARLAGEALDDVRRSVGSLRADTSRPPLPEALRALTHNAGLPVTVRIEGSARELPPGVEHALFRSAQEALTNVCKHAAASAAEIELDFRVGERVQLTVLDNGRGLDGENTHGGFGLRGIRERIEILGGRIETGNRRGGGFALMVEVPA